MSSNLPLRLAGKVALVTGASGGIGRSIARRLANDGASVVVHFNTKREPAETLVAELCTNGRNAIAAPADLTQVDEVLKLFKVTSSYFGGLDIVVANAGVESLRVPLVDVTDEAFERVLAGNTRASFFVLREAARTVRDAGRIVAIGSSITAHPAAGFGAYAATKASILMLIPILAAELAARMITANLVLAGPTDAGFLEKWSKGDKDALAAASPFKRLGTPEDTADIVAFLASDDARWLSGQALVANGAASI